MWRIAGVAAAGCAGVLVFSGAPLLSAMNAVGAGSVTFTVDSFSALYGDNNTGDNKCITNLKDDNGKNVCTLRAAIEQANATDASTQVTINVASHNGDWTVWMPDDTTKFMSAGSGPSLEEPNAYFHIKRTMTINMKSLYVTPFENSTIPAAAFWIDAPNVKLENLSDAFAVGSTVYFGANSDGSSLNRGSSRGWRKSDNLKRMVTVDSGASDITISNYTMGRYTDYNGAMIQVNGTTTSPVKNLTISNVIFDNTPPSATDACSATSSTGCSPRAINIGTSKDGGQGTVQGLVIDNCQFIYFRGDRSPLYLYYTKESSNWTITGNTFTDIGTIQNANSPALRLPQGTPLGGKNLIEGNHFDNSDKTAGGYAITWTGNRGANSTVSSNLTIRGNDFDGYKAQSIFLNAVGTATVEKNIFGQNSGSRPNTKDEEEEGRSGGTGNATMVMNYNNSTNRRIRTWYPTEASVEECKLEVAVTPPVAADADFGSPNLPVRLDFYYTAERTAELYLYSVNLTSASPTSVELPDLPPGPGYIRLQTQGKSATSGMFESSQYSRAVEVADPSFCYRPYVDLELRAWQGVDPQKSDHDAIIAAGTAGTAKEIPNEIPGVKKGFADPNQPIWLTYTVTNTGWEPINVTVRDENDNWICDLAGLPAKATKGCSALRPEAAVP